MLSGRQEGSGTVSLTSHIRVAIKREPERRITVRPASFTVSLPLTVTAEGPPPSTSLSQALQPARSSGKGPFHVISSNPGGVPGVRHHRTSGSLPELLSWPIAEGRKGAGAAEYSFGGRYHEETSHRVTLLLKHLQRLPTAQHEVQNQMAVTFTKQLPCPRHHAGCVKCVICNPQATPLDIPHISPTRGVRTPRVTEPRACGHDHTVCNWHPEGPPPGRPVFFELLRAVLPLPLPGLAARAVPHP